MYLSDAHQIRNADAVMIEKLGFPGLLLMETAGRLSAQHILSHFPQFDHYLILVGPGNNGGDGWVIARYLYLAGKSVSLYMATSSSRYTGDALVNYQVIQAQVECIEISECSPSALAERFPTQTLLIDAMLGTGVTGALRVPFEEIVTVFSASSFPCVAIDLPSGLDANTGKTHSSPIPATHTLTFQLPKLCHYITPAATFCGEVFVLDIGIWPEVVEGLGIRREVITPAHLQFSTRKPDGHKGTFGHALLVGGSKNMAGAIALAGAASLATGAGLATALIPASARCAFYEKTWGVMTHNVGTDETPFLQPEHISSTIPALAKKSAVAIGPGMGNTPETLAFFRELLPKISVPTVIDADGLNLLAASPELWEHLPAHTLLTPHPGEMARLTGKTDIQAERLEIAEAFAKEKQVILILKGMNTLVALPDGTTFVNPTGNAGMGTAGMGDVLTGTLVSLLAQGYPPALAAIMGVYLHGAAGDLMAAEVSPSGVTAQGLLPYLGKAILAQTSISS